MYEKRVLYRLAQKTEAEIHRRLRPHHRRGEWFSVDLDCARHTVDGVYAEVLALDQPPLEPEGLLDLTRWSDHAIDANAMEAIAWFRTLMNDWRGKALAGQIVQAIGKANGKAAMVAFQTEIVSRTPLSKVLTRHPGDLRKAHAALAKAINTLCDIFAARREQALLDKIREIAA